VCIDELESGSVLKTVKKKKLTFRELLEHAHVLLHQACDENEFFFFWHQMKQSSRSA
jgi:hypothetical protein